MPKRKTFFSFICLLANFTISFYLFYFICDSGCHPRLDSPFACGRVLVDNFADEKTSSMLISIAQKVMQHTDTTGGPIIGDINSGKIGQ